MASAEQYLFELAEHIPRLIARLDHHGARLMSAMDHLSTSVAALASVVAAEISAHAAEVADLTQKLKDAVAAGDPTAIETFATAIDASVSKLNGAVATAAAPAAPVVPPAPAA